MFFALSSEPDKKAREMYNRGFFGFVRGGAIVVACGYILTASPCWCGGGAGSLEDRRIVRKCDAVSPGVKVGLDTPFAPK